MKSISSSSISSISSSSGIGADGTAGSDEELTPEEVAQVLQELVQDGTIMPADATRADEELTPEEVAQVLQELVQEGAVTPEDAEQVLAHICAGNISARRAHCGTASRK